MKDTRVEVRIYNRILYDLIFSRYTTICAFCKDVHVHQTTVGEFLNVKRTKPFLKNGEYSAAAQRIAEFFGMEPEMLFPASLYKVAAKDTLVLEVSSQNVVCSERSAFRKYLPDTALLDDSVRQSIAEALYELKYVERKVIMMRVFENMTLQACGEKLNLTRERIRQIEDRAYAKLRQPYILKKLEEIR